MISLYTILILAAIGFQAFFTASEMAFTSVNRIKLKSLLEAGDPKAKELHEFLTQEGGFLGTTLMGTNIAVVIASVLATRVFAEYFGAGVLPLVTTVCMVPVMLVFAEIVPKIIARQFSTDFALKVTKPLKGFHKVFYPVIVAVNTVAKVMLLPFGSRETPWDISITKGDLKKILLLGHETGEVEADEVELIHKVLDFGGKKVEGIMVPLYRVSSIASSDTTDNLKKLASVTGFSRIPVYEENKNNIVGIANIYDILFNAANGDKEPVVKSFMREAVYVKKDDGLDIALARLRHREQPMGIVVEEDNRVVGIVTIEDMLEEIVGEI